MTTSRRDWCRPQVHDCIVYTSTILFSLQFTLHSATADQLPTQTPYTCAEKFESFERINSIRETIHPFETNEFFCSCIRGQSDSMRYHLSGGGAGSGQDCSPLQWLANGDGGRGGGGGGGPGRLTWRPRRPLTSRRPSGLTGGSYGRLVARRGQMTKRKG